MPPSPVVSKRSASNIISTNHVVDTNTTHRFSETPSWVSNGSLSPSSGENPSSPVAGEALLLAESKGGLATQSSGIHERSVECSTQLQGLIGTQVLTLFLSDEIGEEQWNYDAIINNKINKSKENTPEDTAASMLPLSTSIPSSMGHPAPTASICPPSDEPSPPVEVVTR